MTDCLLSTPDSLLARSVGIFDSGVGGLSVLREISSRLPCQDIVYLADEAHVPYGSRSMGEIRAFSRAITAFLVEQGACLVVVACNTASAAALHHLRGWFGVPIVGMEPAIKPAAERTRSRHVGVIATQATFQGELFSRLLERFAQGTSVHTQVCPGLVERVEAGSLDDAETESMLRSYLQPLLSAGVDSLVLGCTHYPFLLPAIRRVVGPDVDVLDPAPAVARQTEHVLESIGRRCLEGVGRVTYFTTGSIPGFEAKVERLISIPGTVCAATWKTRRLLVASPPVSNKNGPHAAGHGGG
jgi:glutamate racemase